LGRLGPLLLQASQLGLELPDLLAQRVAILLKARLLSLGDPCEFLALIVLLQYPADALKIVGLSSIHRIIRSPSGPPIMTDMVHSPWFVVACCHSPGYCLRQC